MVLIDDKHSGEADAYTLWNLIGDLTDQLTQNRSLLAALHSQAGGVKNQAIHSQTGFVLRRFNTDKSQEVYDAELENMTHALKAENHELQHDNKQLGTIIKEYEQTLETLMSTFRTRAHEVQERELTLIREFEAQLLTAEEATGEVELSASTALSSSLARISYALRQLLRMQNGEDPEPLPSTTFDPDEVHDIEEREPWLSPSRTRSDYALERDCELARLEMENEELRRMLGLLPPRLPKPLEDPAEISSRMQMKRQMSSPAPPENTSMQRVAGGIITAGPYGTFKRIPG